MSEQEKRNAASAALDRVESGMVVGLGTGSTAEFFIRGLGQRVKAGLDITAVPTSKRTEDLARSCGIRIAEIKNGRCIDLTVDGADEVGPGLAMIKGAGGALLREKIVAAASEKMIAIVDSSKVVETLGKFPLSIEIIRFGALATQDHIQAACKEFKASPSYIRVREDPVRKRSPFITDSGNLILDCACGEIPDPAGLAQALSNIPGVVEHGLFIDLADFAIVGTAEGADVLRG